MNKAIHRLYRFNFVAAFAFIVASTTFSSIFINNCKALFGTKLSLTGILAQSISGLMYFSAYIVVAGMLYGIIILLIYKKKKKVLLFRLRNQRLTVPKQILSSHQGSRKILSEV